MRLDFADRMLGQVLVDLGNDARLDVVMECVAQIGQRFGGATTTSAGTFRLRTTSSIAAATLRVKRCSSIWCQSTGSTALRWPETSVLLTWPGPISTRKQRPDAHRS
jgi:hypothetical protein